MRTLLFVMLISMIGTFALAGGGDTFYPEQKSLNYPQQQMSQETANAPWGGKEWSLVAAASITALGGVVTAIIQIRKKR